MPHSRWHRDACSGAMNTGVPRENANAPPYLLHQVRRQRGRQGPCGLRRNRLLLLLERDTVYRDVLHQILSDRLLGALQLALLFFFLLTLLGEFLLTLL